MHRNQNEPAGMQGAGMQGAGLQGAGLQGTGSQFRLLVFDLVCKLGALFLFTTLAVDVHPDLQ